MSHKPIGRLPVLSTRPAVTSAMLKRAATSFAVWWTEARWVWAVCLRLLPDSVATASWTRAFCAWVQHANHSATEPLIDDDDEAANSGYHCDRLSRDKVWAYTAIDAWRYYAPPREHSTPSHYFKLAHSQRRMQMSQAQIMITSHIASDNETQS